MQTSAGGGGGGGGSGILAASLLELGILSRSITGRPFIDMVLSILLYMTFAYARNNDLLGRAAETAERVRSWRSRSCVRAVERVAQRNIYMNEMENDTLYKAVMLYLNRFAGMGSCLREGTATLADGERGGAGLCRRRDDSDEGGGERRRSAVRLRRPGEKDGPQVSLTPKHGGWHRLRVPEEVQAGDARCCRLDVMYRREVDSGAQITRTADTVFLRVTAPLGADPCAAADRLLACAHRYYAALIRDELAGARFYFSPVGGGAEAREGCATVLLLDGNDAGGRHGGRAGGGGGRNCAVREFSRYALSEDVSFDTLYHPRVGEVVALLDALAAGTGKFAVPGFPRKLGFLLHGPPGTGKTSFIKAIARHTRRHIVSVPLDRVGSAEELAAIMLDRRIRAGGETVVLGSDDVVFVMEDIDAAGALVHKRTGKTEGAGGGEGAAPVAAATAAYLPSIGPVLLQPAAAATAASPAKRPTLTLADVLSVLDGPVDTPGRIVVMTSNHPERLDPALVRPGRINASIELGNVRAEEARLMLRDFFGEDAAAAAEPALRAALEAVPRSPAHLKMLCGLHEDARRVIQALGE